MSMYTNITKYDEQDNMSKFHEILLLSHTVPTEREWMKKVLKLLVWIFMLSRVGLIPGSNISKIYGLKFEKTQILEFSLQNDSF